MTKCRGAPISMLSNFFGKKKVLRGNLVEIWCIKIQMYPQTSIDPKYGAFNLKKLSHCPLISFTSSTELKSSSSF